MKFCQVHTFYTGALKRLYQMIPGLNFASFADQTKALVKDAFSGIHMFAPYMFEVGYDSTLIIANNLHAQFQWIKENPEAGISGKIDLLQLVQKQIENIQPDVLYLSDPITFNGDFLSSLNFKPPLVVGWRAANIPESINWKGFDLMFSNLDALREIALNLGVRRTEHFFPGFPAWIYEEIKDIQPEYDVVFCGQVGFLQHTHRNQLLHEVAKASFETGKFKCAYFLSGDPAAMTPELKKVNKGKKYGIEMHRALRKGRICIDGRGDIGLVDNSGKTKINLAKSQTSNMRIFEATGSGLMLLTEHHENLRDYFEPGVEIETFRDMLKSW